MTPRPSSVARLASLLAALVVGCASPPVPSVSEPASDAPNGPPAAFDLAGTSWHVETINGVAVAQAQAPTLVLDLFGRDSAFGWTGCEDFGVDIALDGGSVAVGDVNINPGGCDGATGELERAYVETLRGADTYRVDGDLLLISGELGEMIMRRTVPRAGDPGRVVLETLRGSDWQITEATGLRLPEAVSPVRFSDESLIAVGDCGFSAQFTIRPDSAIAIDQVGYDLVSCGAEADAAREAVVTLLTSATLELDRDGAIVLQGPGKLRFEPIGPVGP